MAAVGVTALMLSSAAGEAAAQPAAAAQPPASQAAGAQPDAAQPGTVKADVTALLERAHAGARKPGRRRGEEGPAVGGYQQLKNGVPSDAIAGSGNRHHRRALGDNHDGARQLPGQADAGAACRIQAGHHRHPRPPAPSSASLLDYRSVRAMNMCPHPRLALSFAGSTARLSCSQRRPGPRAGCAARGVTAGSHPRGHHLALVERRRAVARRALQPADRQATRTIPPWPSCAASTRRWCRELSSFPLWDRRPAASHTFDATLGTFRRGSPSVRAGLCRTRADHRPPAAEHRLQPTSARPTTAFEGNSDPRQRLGEVPRATRTLRCRRTGGPPLPGTVPTPDGSHETPFFEGDVI